MTCKKAIIACAGFGTRFLPITKVVPKEIFPIVDTSTLEYVINEAVSSGIDEIMIVISPQKQEIKRLFCANEPLNELLRARGEEENFRLANKKFPAKIQFVTQTQMNGNANAIKLCRDFVGHEPFAVLFGDDVTFSEGKPVTRQLIDAYEKTGCTVVGCGRPSEEVARRCGVMQVKGDDSKSLVEIEGIIEKPEGKLPSHLVSLGRFILTEDIFDAIDKTPPKDGEVYLTDAISLLAKTKHVYAAEYFARRYDIGNKEGYLEAVVEFALRNPETKDKFKEYLKNLKY